MFKPTTFAAFVLLPFAALAQESAPPAADSIPVATTTPETPAPAAEPKAEVSPTVQITATKMPVPVASLPAAITVISGDDLRARGATDLRGALSGVSGVEISPGGDNGPEGSTPAFQGLREFDAFLLVVDGVPAGGAFNPALTTLDLHNVERIEVMKGAAPVMYGATSFVGVIHVIHYAAGSAEQTVSAALGGPNSEIGFRRAAGAISLGSIGDWKHSLSADYSDRALADPGAGSTREHATYRLGGALGEGRAWLDADINFLQQKPDSPVVLEGTALTTKTPLDANHNPSDARLDEDRYQLNLGYALPTFLGDWQTQLSVASTDAKVLRGFLRAALTDDGSTPNADGYDQSHDLRDVYFDTHLGLALNDSIDLVYGIDALLGTAKQHNRRFKYYAALNGGNRQSSAQGVPESGRDFEGNPGFQQEVMSLEPVCEFTGFLGIDPSSPVFTCPDETIGDNEAKDERTFLGAYVQADWKLMPTLDLLAGLRLNRTDETRDAAETEGGTVRSGHETLSKTRPAYSLGASWRAWEDEADHLTVFADVRDTYKPAAFEFAPELEATILKPETAQSYELGFKSAWDEGHLTLEMDYFDTDFRNVLVAERQGVFNVGRSHLRGVEAEGRYAFGGDWSLSASAANHDARFEEGTTSDGVNLAGHELQLSPHWLGSLGLLLAPQQGLSLSAAMNYTGERFLDKENTARAEAYASFDASVGYRYHQYRVQLIGSNLTDRRDAVSESEFSQVATPDHAQSYYRLPAREVLLNFTLDIGA